MSNVKNMLWVALGWETSESDLLARYRASKAQGEDVAIETLSRLLQKPPKIGHFCDEEFQYWDKITLPKDEDFIQVLLEAVDEAGNHLWERI